MTSKKPEQLIRLYKIDEDGSLYDAKEDFDLADFCGIIPRVGDLILSRWLRGAFYEDSEDAREKARLWQHRTVHVVETVYFRSDKRDSDEDDSWVVLVVKDRSMTEAEQALL